MHGKDESTTSSVLLGRLRACCWEIGLYLSVYRSCESLLTGLETGRRRSVTEHRLKPHQTPALRRPARRLLWNWEWRPSDKIRAQQKPSSSGINRHVSFIDFDSHGFWSHHLLKAY